MFANLRQDTRRLKAIKSKPFPWYVLESLLFENGYQAVVLYRLASWFRHRGIPLLGPAIARAALFLTGVDISPTARIGPGLMISHGTGVVVGGAARIGAEATLMHNVTLGAPRTHRREEMPVLGDRVFLGTGATLIGGITVGDDVLVGAGCLVTGDLPAGSTVMSDARLTVAPRSGGAGDGRDESGAP